MKGEINGYQEKNKVVSSSEEQGIVWEWKDLCTPKHFTSMHNPV